MSDTYKFSILIEKNGAALPNMPLIRRINVAEDAELNLTATPDNNSTSFHEIAAATMAAMGVLFLTVDQAVNLKFNLNTPVPLDAGGVVLIIGTNLTQATPPQNVEYNNPALTGGVNATLTGVVAGT